jgi:type IV secretory pathway protease TraF
MKVSVNGNKWEGGRRTTETKLLLIQDKQSCDFNSRYDEDVLVT